MAVREAVARLEGLRERPTLEQADVLEQVHASLQDALAHADPR